MSKGAPLARPLPALAIIIGGIVLDQISKYWMETALPFETPVRLLPILSLYRTWNEGIAFSMLAGQNGIAIVVMRLVIVAAVIVWWRRSRDAGPLLHLGFALIISGAIGNLIDRFIYGHVIDFILFHMAGWSFAVFNFADSFITLGAIAVGTHELFLTRKPNA